MANSQQATKRARQAQKRRLHNNALESEMRTYLKAARSAANDGNIEQAKSSALKAVSSLDKLAKTGIIHANKASRLKSRLSLHIKKAGSKS